MVHLKLLHQPACQQTVSFQKLSGLKLPTFFKLFYKTLICEVEMGTFIFFEQRFEKYNRKDVFRLLN